MQEDPRITHISASVVATSWILDHYLPHYKKKIPLSPAGDPTTHYQLIILHELNIVVISNKDLLNLRWKYGRRERIIVAINDINNYPETPCFQSKTQYF